MKNFNMVGIFCQILNHISRAITGLGAMGMINMERKARKSLKEKSREFSRLSAYL